MPSNLLSHCTSLQNDIPYCRAKGVKVILSIGGVYDSASSNYLVPDNSTGTEFATFLYNAFGPYNSSWTGPRPFDSSPTDHTSVDGFDFDIEMNFREFPPPPPLFDFLLALNAKTNYFLVSKWTLYRNGQHVPLS